MSLANIPKELADYYGMVQSRLGRLWDAQNRLCHWCKCETILTRHELPNKATEDHILPRGGGGSNEDFNVVCACQNCNRRRNKEFALGMAEGALLKQYGSKVPHGNYNKAVDMKKKGNILELSVEIDRLTNELAISKHAYEQQVMFRRTASEKLAELTDYTTHLTVAGLIRQKFVLWRDRSSPILTMLKASK